MKSRINWADGITIAAILLMIAFAGAQPGLYLIVAIVFTGSAFDIVKRRNYTVHYWGAVIDRPRVSVNKLVFWLATVPMFFAEGFILVHFWQSVFTSGAVILLGALLAVAQEYSRREMFSHYSESQKLKRNLAIF